DALGARSLVGAGAMLVLALIAVAGIGLGLAGLAAIAVFAVLAALGRVRGAGPPAVGRASVHAEVFAAWMVSYFAVNRGIGWAVDRVEALGMPRPSTEAMLALTLVVDAAALAFALWWGTRRGLTWRTLRAQVGLTPPRVSDVLWGVVTYAMGIVFLAVGIGLALILSALFGEGGFGGVSHPIQGLIADGSGLAVLLSFVLAAVAAPIGEEIAFRGALYRNLRDTFGRASPLVGAVVASGVGCVLFAAIHPQGFVFIPVRGGLARAFCISREWTGSINPAIVAHAINNAVMVGLNVVLLR
ncbi:MAG: lysostaphin resistance A-like protein, partial [Phycisphaerales bacterium]